MVNIKKKHRLCPCHYISYSQKTICPKCKIRKSTKCNECNITASYNFEKLRSLKCLKHRKKGMINIKRNHTLCEKHDISHSKKTGCKICKLDIDNYYNSTNYMKEKINKKFKDDLIEKIKKKFKNQSHMEMFNNILNNSKDKKIIKFKIIHDEREKLKYITHFIVGNRYIYYGLKSKIYDLCNKIKKLNLSKRKLYTKFDKSNYKNLNEYIENNKNNNNVLNYKKIEKEISLIKHDINEKVKKLMKIEGM